MEKVKLTKSQAEEIERIKKVGYPVMWKVDGWYISRGDKIKDLSFYQYITAINEGYEVEPKFKVGDWVVPKKPYRSSSLVCKVVEAQDCTIKLDQGYSHFEPMSDFGYATQEEIAKEKTRRWWAKHDREVWQLKRHDVLKDDRGNSFEVDGFLGSGEEQKVLFKPGHRDFMSNVKDSYGIVCFAEDRKDI